MASHKLSINALDLYNNPEDSDIKIKLNDGSHIHAHKIILKRASDMCRNLFNNKMKESNTGEITFPEHEDAVVVSLVQYIYGREIIHKLGFTQWSELFEFGDYLQVKPLLDSLETNVPADAPLNEIIEFAWKHERDAIMTSAIKRSLNLYYITKDSGNDTEARSDLMNTIANVNYDAYIEFHGQWVRKKFNPRALFHIDCHYVDHNSTDETCKTLLMNELITDIKFDTFGPTHIACCMDYPVVCDMPIIQHMLRCIARITNDRNADGNKYPDVWPIHNEHAKRKMDLPPINPNTGLFMSPPHAVRAQTWDPDITDLLSNI